MHKFKPNIIPQSHQTSSLLLNHIKDQQFYSTLSTITLQLAKESGMRKQLLQQLSSCFSKVKGSSNESMLTYEKQNNHIELKSEKGSNSYYDSFQKDISLKQQVNFISKMQSQLIQSRQKQNSINALKKYAAQKDSQLLPLLTIEAPTKNDRFKHLLSRKRLNKINTRSNYFKMNALDLLKNVYEDSNQCYTIMRSFSLLKTMFGHSMDQDRQSNCPLYNVLFDQSQKLIISGGQQGAIKIWSKQTGLLLSSLKGTYAGNSGHQEFINKLEITKCNKYIYSSAGDGIRFFQLKDMTTLGGWKTESIIDITSVYDKFTGLNRFFFGDKRNFYVLDEVKMLACQQRALTKDDFSIYRYSHKISKQSYILNIQVSQDQTYVLLGFQNGDIMLFHYQDLFNIQPLKQQTDPLSNHFNLPIKHHLRIHKDQIRELKWHPNNQYFVSGGKQGFCLLWEYKDQKAPVLLKQIQVSKLFNRRKKRAFGCNFICFNSTYTHFVGGFMELVDDDDEDRGNGDIIAYSLQEKEVIFQFSKDMPIKVASVRGMDTHPTYPNIVVVCQGTGRILILDFLLKSILNTFQIRGHHLLHPQFSLNPGDCRFSKDGKYFVVSTQFGSISIFGYDLKNFYETCPSQQFFSNDFTAFTVNQNMKPIPIEGDMQIDMNRVERGQIRKIRGDAYEHQFKNNFQKYWTQSQRIDLDNPINHKNTIISKDQHYNQQNNEYNEYLQKIKFNASEPENFQKQNYRILEEIQNTKQSLIYDERQKQSRVFKKIIEDKMRKIRGQQVSKLPQLTHDILLQQIDAKGKRGGRRLTKICDRQNFPNYKDDFQYNSQNQEQYNIQQDDQEDLKQLDVNVSNSSDQIPITTRRNRASRVSRRTNDHQRRYNIRSRPNQRYNYQANQESQQEEKRQRNRKRRTPAQDIEDMLQDQQFKHYDMNKGRKKRKLNRMRQSDDSDQEVFINDLKSQQSDYDQNSDKSERKRRQRTNSHTQKRRGRPRRNQIIELQDQSSQQYNRLKKIEQKSQDQDLQNAYQIQDNQNIRNLRNRNGNYSNNKNDYSSNKNYHSSNKNQYSHNKSQNQSTNKKQKKNKHQDLGQCYRCAVNPAVVICKQCECACCQNCKLKRGKQSEGGKFKCFICIYLSSTGTAILQQKKLSQEYFRLNQRSQQVYVPQIDDQVRYFFQGYQQFLSQNVKNLNTEVTDSIPDYLLMPHIYNQTYGQVLLHTPLCKVKDIKYFFPFNNADALSNTYKRRIQTNQKKHIHMLVNLQVIPKDQIQKKQLQRNDFWVFFIPGPVSIQSTNQYLLRQEVYQYIQQNKLLQKLSQNQTLNIQGQQYQIVNIGAAEDTFPESIWKQIQISRCDGKRLRNMSKQADKRCNIWNLSELMPKIQYKNDNKTELQQKKILDRIKHVRQNQSQHVLYDDYIDFDIYPAYRKVVEVGICLSSIETRVRNNFYRSLNGLQFDLDHMVKNTVAFNGKDNHVSRIGMNIRKQIFKAINISDDKLKDLSIQEEESQKRQKRNTRKKQSQQNKKSIEPIQQEQPRYNVRTLRNVKGKSYDNEFEQKKTDNNKHKRKISQDSSFSAQAVSEQKVEEEDSDEVKEVSKFENKRNNRRSERVTREKPSISYRQKMETTSKSKKTDKLMQEYGKEEQVYRNIQNRRNRASRYIDSSHDSYEKNSGSAAAVPTRRSSRLQN